MNLAIFKQLLEKNIITQEEFDKVEQSLQKPISLHWDLRVLLYLGILLVTTALSILVYKNIDTIGHDVIIIAIAVACTACFIYCFKKSSGYSSAKIESPDILYDYILLTGCLLLVTFIAYIQYQYNVFGSRLGLAAFIPMVLLFAAAYYFDHLGILSMAITNLAAWLGIAVTPMQILKENNFSDERLIYTGILLGAALTGFSYLIKHKNIKAHFDFTYKNFGLHVLFISLLSAMFHYYIFYLPWFLAIAVAGFFSYKMAVKENSFYFLVITVLYFYIALSFVIIRLIFTAGDGIGGIYMTAIYFIGSGIGLIRLLIYFNKKLKHNAGLQQR